MTEAGDRKPVTGQLLGSALKLIVKDLWEKIEN